MIHAPLATIAGRHGGNNRTSGRGFLYVPGQIISPHEPHCFATRNRQLTLP